MAVSLNVSTGFVKQTNKNRTVSYIDGWTKIETPKYTIKIVTYIANGTAKQFEIGVVQHRKLTGNVVS